MKAIPFMHSQTFPSSVTLMPIWQLNIVDGFLPRRVEAFTSEISSSGIFSIDNVPYMSGLSTDCMFTPLLALSLCGFYVGIREAR